MKKMLCLIIGISLLAAAVAGCTTPQAALDQPNQAAMLTMALEKELREFRALQSGFAKARVDAIRSQEAQIATYEVESGFDQRAKRMAGNDKDVPLLANLTELAESRAIDDAALKARLAELDASMAKLVNPVPEMSTKLKATQAALAALGQDLSAEDRARLVVNFSRELQDQIKKAKAGAAASAPAP